MPEPDLPDVLAHWVTAKNAHDVDGQLSCFSPTASVDDEGETVSGTDAVRAWIERVTAAYDLTVEPTAWEPSIDGGVLVAEVSGDFPGSPLEFRYHLSLDGGLISALRTEA